MAGPYTWNVNLPTGAEDPGSIDDIIRDQIKSPLNQLFTDLMPNWPQDCVLAQGTARIKTGVEASLPASAQDGELYWATDTRALWVRQSGSWRQIQGGRYVEIPLVSGFSWYGQLGGGDQWCDLPEEWATADTYSGVAYLGMYYPATTSCRLRVVHRRGAYHATAKYRLSKLVPPGASWVTISESLVESGNTAVEMLRSKLFALDEFCYLRLQGAALRTEAFPTHTISVYSATLEVRW